MFLRESSHHTGECRTRRNEDDYGLSQSDDKLEINGDFETSLSVHENGLGDIGEQSCLSDGRDEEPDVRSGEEDPDCRGDSHLSGLKST